MKYFFLPWRGKGQFFALTFCQIKSSILILLCVGLPILPGLPVMGAPLNWQLPRITMSFKNTPLTKVLTEIEKQSKYGVFYNSELIKPAVRVDVSVKDMPLDAALNECLAGQPFSYKIDETSKHIVIVRKQAGVSSNITNNDRSPSDTTITVAGRVRASQTGEALPGVTVLVKGTGKGTVTNERGEFVLRDIPATIILVFRSIGYIAEEVSLPGQFSNISVVMKEATSELDKIVVQGYGTTSKRFIAGNIATVTAEDIEKRPVMNVLHVLQGKVAGLEVTQLNGYASAPFKVELRGRKLIPDNASPDPLFIVDGVPLTILELYGGNANGGTTMTQNGFPGPAGGYSPLFGLNPNDIESISVLKDADATAIYGSRGGSGVILITTKRGKIGKPKLEINYYSGWQNASNDYKMLNSEQYVEMRKEAFKNDNVNLTPSNAADILIWDTTRYTNWQKVLWGSTGMAHDVQLSFSGGHLSNTFRIGGGYHEEKGVTNFNGANKEQAFSLISHIKV